MKDEVIGLTIRYSRDAGEVTQVDESPALQREDPLLRADVLQSAIAALTAVYEGKLLVLHQHWEALREKAGHSATPEE